MNAPHPSAGALRLIAGGLFVVAACLVAIDGSTNRLAAIVYAGAAAALFAAVSGLVTNTLGPAVTAAALLLVATVVTHSDGDRISAVPVFTAALSIGALECFALYRRLEGVCVAPPEVSQEWLRRIVITIGAGTVFGLVVMLFDGVRLGSTPLAPMVAALIVAGIGVLLRRELPGR